MRGFSSTIWAAPSAGTKNSMLKKHGVEPVRGHEQRRKLSQLVQLLRSQGRRILETLEGVRAGVLDRVGDPDDSHLALVHEALERDLVSCHELFDEEAANRILGQPGELGVLVPVALVIDQLGKLGLSVDAPRLLGQPAHDRLRPPRRRKGRSRVSQGEPGRRLRRQTLLNRSRGRLVLARHDRGGARPRQPAALGELGGEQRGAVLRADNAVGRKLGQLLEQRSGVDRSRVEIRSGEPHGEVGRTCSVTVPFLRTDDEDLTHPCQSRLPASCAEPQR